MDKIREEIKIIDCHNGIVWRDRISLSSGTKQASNSTDNGSISYCNDAIVPKLPWRTVTPIEHKILFSNKTNNSSNLYITILNIPRNILLLLKDLANVKHHTELIYVLERENIKKGIGLIQEYIETFCIQNADISEYGIGSNSPNQITVTTSNRGCIVGLHIDNQKENVSSLHRILINLGSQPRYLLFINLSIQQLYKFISKKDDDLVSESYGSSRIARVFMELFPNYPVIKLRIDPGEAYIAPTEHITHDGCTEGTDSLDVFFTMRTLFDYQRI